MKAVIVRTALGPVQVWVLADPESQEPPETAVLPGVTARPARVFGYKGQGMSWLDWGNQLASSPASFPGNWSVEDVQGGLSPEEVLDRARHQDVVSSAKA